ncbi:nitroreductase [Clostridium acetobutylicum]|uniref:Nitroreductase family protein n=2 Tax=Clostridium acetobutylicum TaxID=1488 RepID=Q97IT9_CLOAB|nr:MULTISPECIES: nitroreductase family protein [Clostridium]AAK79518.1 Nitroreductase family protein [Clostridium acetobutylicum ATCC 824]ADZ20603.1 Nitroreductase family protein [Clostridium acetobutylicum EA 2018]AEI33083.1 nitroreductase family protein [Clostridium acetobutylicum DSM 1731]AWV81237.1 nitroreductase family protein [Clostridium acetobutylicum]MBC2392870.1 nitroreductase family protein [Clostridium acetobutylicum]
MDIINNRRSIRNYKGKKVEKEKIEKLLRAAMQAPSAGNQQPWEFIVLEDRENIDKLSNFSKYANSLKTAPLAIVLLADEEKMKISEMWEQDMAAAAENILLEAAYLDLGAVWLGAQPIEERVKNLKEMFNLKSNIKPFCVISVGYPENSENKFIDRFDAKRIHIEKY